MLVASLLFDRKPHGGDATLPGRLVGAVLWPVFLPLVVAVALCRKNRSAPQPAPKPSDADNAWKDRVRDDRP
jgi:hypothetical protein